MRMRVRGYDGTWGSRHPGMVESQYNTADGIEITRIYHLPPLVTTGGCSSD